MDGMDDERLERALERLRELGRRHEDQVLSQMERTIEVTPSKPLFNGAPAPLECHPYYRDQHPWIKDWLDGKTFGGSQCLQVPVSRPPRLFVDPEPDLLRPSMMDRLTLTRSRAWALAPYVGRPFVYTWHFATDDHGRMVAGESTIAYTDR